MDIESVIAKNHAEDGILRRWNSPITIHPTQKTFVYKLPPDCDMIERVEANKKCSVELVEVDNHHRILQRFGPMPDHFLRFCAPFTKAALEIIAAEDSELIMTVFKQDISDSMRWHLSGGDVLIDYPNLRITAGCVGRK